MKGDLADLGVADLLYLLALRRQTGRLSVLTSCILTHLYLANGRLVLATSTDPVLRLGQILLAAGAVSADQLTDVLDEQAQSAELRPLGPLLIDRGLVSAADVERALHAQMLGALVRVLTVAEGRFLFERAVWPPPELPIPNIDTDALLLESVRAVDIAADEPPLAPEPLPIGLGQPMRGKRPGLTRRRRGRSPVA
jgi:hypothetical protein